MNKKCLLSLGLAALALILAAGCGPAVRHPAVPLHWHTNQDTVQVGLLPLKFSGQERGEKVHLIGFSPPEYHDYFHESSEFAYGIRGLGQPNVSQRVIRAVYLQHFPRITDHWARDDYRFDWPDMGQAFTLGVLSGFSQPLNLIPGTVYDLIQETHPGWPSTYGLVIKQGGELVFQGLTDWRVNGTVSPDSLSPVRVSQTRVLNDHYMKSGHPCYGRITNIEVTFSLASERLVLRQGQSSRVVLHQGQSARLGRYEVNLLVARSIEYTGKCLDAGINGVSFTVTRCAEQQGASRPQPLGDCFTIYLKPGVIEFPYTSDGYPSHMVVPADSVRFPRASVLGEILRALGWSACEKTVSALREGDTVQIPPSHLGKEDERQWTRHYSEQISRAYTVYVRPDSSRALMWRSDARERFLESTYVDSVEFSPPP